MDVPANLKSSLTEKLAALCGKTVSITQCTPLQGRDINDSFRLDTTEGNYFLKINDAAKYPGLFAAEAKGLEMLGAAGAVPVPQPLAFGGNGEQQYLLTTFLKRELPAARDFWVDFGRGLAALHRHSAARFGLDSDNYIGTLVQQNTPADTWSGFYRRHRLEPLIRALYDRGVLEKSWLSRADYLYERLSAVFPEAPPSLLHGDLWSGNFMVGPGGKACLYDPAVYYGHREMDLAMTRLFGGFDRRFYSAYEEAWPLEEGWQERVCLCQLYPLLVHALLFGGSYISEIKDILKMY
ncbi:fructosamine kinase family protein [Compostibacter hankyongensis]|uniref:Fructosamine kinase family protein n=1 Tax=Compostibacter hankyongensis TaxID=1007089 RepID=A0ABP8FWY8_9BACT